MNGETGNRNFSDLQATSALAHSSLLLHNSAAFLALAIPLEAASTHTVN